MTFPQPGLGEKSTSYVQLFEGGNPLVLQAHLFFKPDFNLSTPVLLFPGMSKD